MGFTEELNNFSTQVMSRKQHCIGNEEATKQALIVPFLQLLGYDVWNPKELVPEYGAGFASSKEKIDYAIFIEENPVFLIEAKAYGKVLENYDAQLAKYFNSTHNMKVAIISDGVIYKFFTDLKRANLMDDEPFFIFNVENFNDDQFSIIQNFRRENFNLEQVITQAEDLVYLHGLDSKFRQIFKNPTDEFIRFIASDIYPRKMTANAIERLRPLVKQSMSSTLIRMVSEGLTQEISKSDEPQVVKESTEPIPTKQELDKKEKALPETTKEEIQAFAEVTTIINHAMETDVKLDYKDTVNYFSIHLGKPSRWFIRLHLNSEKARFMTLRLPEDKATQIDPSIEYSNYRDEAIKVNLTDENPLSRYAQLITEAYKDVANQFEPTSSE